MSILNNTALLNSLLEQANALPDAGGVELPELINPATQTEIFSGKQVIDEEGNVITGSFTIDNELSTQDDLIAQIQSALVGKGAGGGGEGSVETITIEFTDMPEPGMKIYYIDETMSLQSANINRGDSYTITKNTIFVVENCTSPSIVGNNLEICGNARLRAFLATA